MLTPDAHYVSKDLQKKHEHVPSVIVLSGGNASVREDSLTFDEHFLSRWEHIVIGAHQVLGNMRIRHNHNQLITKPDGVQFPKLLGPVIKGKLGVLCQEGKRP